MATEDIRNSLSISENLSTAGQPTAEQMRELAAEGIDIIVNLGVLDPGYCLPDEENLAESLGMAYHHIPVDFAAPQFESLTKFFDVLDASPGKRVFVHCAANYRVSIFVALYGQVRLGWSTDRANAHIRRLWNPNHTWSEFIDAARRNLTPPAGAGASQGRTRSAPVIC